MRLTVIERDIQIYGVYFVYDLFIHFFNCYIYLSLGALTLADRGRVISLVVVWSRSPYFSRHSAFQ